MRDHVIAFLLVFFNPRLQFLLRVRRRGIGRGASLFMLVLA